MSVSTSWPSVFTAAHYFETQVVNAWLKEHRNGDDAADLLATSIREIATTVTRRNGGTAVISVEVHAMNAHNSMVDAMRIYRAADKTYSLDRRLSLET